MTRKAYLAGKKPVFEVSERHGGVVNLVYLRKKKIAKAGGVFGGARPKLVQLLRLKNRGADLEPSFTRKHEVIPDLMEDLSLLKKNLWRSKEGTAGAARAGLQRPFLLCASAGRVTGTGVYEAGLERGRG